MWAGPMNALPNPVHTHSTGSSAVFCETSLSAAVASATTCIKNSSHRWGSHPRPRLQRRKQKKTENHQGEPPQSLHWQETMPSQSNSRDTEIEDWLTTCSIYDVPPTYCSKFADGSVLTKLELTLSLNESTLWMERGPNFSIQSPEIGYRLLEKERDAPSVTLTMQYQPVADETFQPVDAHVDFIKYPSCWPQQAQAPWLSWLRKQAQKVLRETDLSYAVANFVEHEGLDFFDRSVADDGRDLILSKTHSSQLNRYACGDLAILDELRLREQNQSVFATILPTLSELDATRAVVVSAWRSFVPVDCPICLEKTSLQDAIDLGCQHCYCQDCIACYVNGVALELVVQIQNPFTCPVVSCRKPMKLETEVIPLLTGKGKAKMVEWRKNVETPFAQYLRRCPRRSCPGREIRQCSPSTPRHVFCVVCQLTWCELCMQRQPSGPLDHPWSDCEMAVVARICRRYRKASPLIQQKAEAKWPWIKEYAAARNEDEVTQQWMQDYGMQQCPGCHTAIERIEGCFHMNCVACDTHFCYECGDRLFPPYYGTHHCWEKSSLRTEED